MSEKVKAALKVLIQAVITAVLVFAESAFFSGCISAGGDVQQTNDITLTLPNVTDVWTERTDQFRCAPDRTAGNSSQIFLNRLTM